VCERILKQCHGKTAWGQGKGHRGHGGAASVDNWSPGLRFVRHSCHTHIFLAASASPSSHHCDVT
jgi:hypothetical protein